MLVNRDITIGTQPETHQIGEVPTSRKAHRLELVLGGLEDRFRLLRDSHVPSPRRCALRPQNGPASGAGGGHLTLEAKKYNKCRDRMIMHAEENKSGKK